MSKLRESRFNKSQDAEKNRQNDSTSLWKCHPFSSGRGMSRANQDWGYPLASHKQEKAHQSHVERWTRMAWQQGNAHWSHSSPSLKLNHLTVEGTPSLWYSPAWQHHSLDYRLSVGNVPLLWGFPARGFAQLSEPGEMMIHQVKCRIFLCLNKLMTSRHFNQIYLTLLVDNTHLLSTVK